jgi:serine/threonine-protein kinase
VNGSTTEDVSPRQSQQRQHELILQVGQGGMSRVFLASTRGPGGFKKLVVIKQLLPELAEDPEFLTMFLEEARLSARLHHRNVVQINEVGFDGTHHYMAMEYLEGQSLETISRRATRTGEPVPQNLHLRMISEACNGLHYAHELTDLDGKLVNLVHRDVSPHNVFVTYNGEVKLLDFGIAKAADSSQQTRTGVLKGKCSYMAPEQFGGRAVDRRADIFAVGVMLWQVVTGQKLWKGLTDIEIFQHLATGDIPSPLTVKPDAPPELVEICMRALAMDPDARFPTAAALQDAIEAYLAKHRPSVNQRQIGQYVAERFEADRAKVKAAIDGELDKSSGPSSAEFLPMLPRIESHEEDEAKNGAAASASALAQDGVPSVQDVSAPGPPPPRRSGFLLGGALVMLGALAIGVSVWRAGSRVASATAPITSAQGAVAEFTQLEIEATPSQATIFVDDVPLSSNPGSARSSGA